jgi:hypothetical protein
LRVFCTLLIFRRISLVLGISYLPRGVRDGFAIARAPLGLQLDVRAWGGPAPEHSQNTHAQ